MGWMATLLGTGAEFMQTQNDGKSSGGCSQHRQGRQRLRGFRRFLFTEQQKEQIKALQASGDLLGAQEIILKEIEAQYGGHC